MKQILNALLAFVFVINHAFSVPSTPTATTTQTPTPAATAATAGGFSAYPPPATPTAGPTDLGVDNYDENSSYGTVNTLTDTGNLTFKTGVESYSYETSRPHAVTKLDGVQKFWYDANGNMTTRIVRGVTYTLGYDEENRLISLKDGTLEVTYRYDGDGKRVSVRQANGERAVYIGSHFEVFITAGYTPPVLNSGCAAPRKCTFIPLAIASLANPPAAPGQIWKSYYSAGSARIAMHIQDNAGQNSSGIYWLYTDHLGSTMVTFRGMGDWSGPSEMRYKAWGESRTPNGALPTQRRYTGQIEDQAGLYFYNARYFDPSWQFKSREPLYNFSYDTNAV